MYRDETAYKDRRLFLGIVGVIALGAGLFAAGLGPVEIYSFYLFAEGGRFHYPGFGFGSFMFGNIAAQIVGYYAIAALLIPLGYGHLRMRRWARRLTLAALWAWLVLGIPLILLTLFTLFSIKELSMAGALTAIVLLAVAYLVLPGALIRAYQGRNVRRSFEARDPAVSWIDRLPVPVLALSLIGVFCLIVLHLLIAFNGLFPAFGAWVTGLPGIVCLDAAILLLAAMLWGLLRSQAWAWWGSVAYYILLATSAMWTLIASSWLEILSAMDLPAAERRFLDGMPLQGWHLAALVGGPLLATLALLLACSGHFSRGTASTSTAGPST